MVGSKASPRESARPRCARSTRDTAAVSKPPCSSGSIRSSQGPPCVQHEQPSAHGVDRESPRVHDTPVLCCEADLPRRIQAAVAQGRDRDQLSLSSLEDQQAAGLGVESHIARVRDRSRQANGAPRVFAHRDQAQFGTRQQPSLGSRSKNDERIRPRRISDAARGRQLPLGRLDHTHLPHRTALSCALAGACSICVAKAPRHNVMSATGCRRSERITDRPSGFSWNRILHHALSGLPQRRKATLPPAFGDSYGRAHIPKETAQMLEPGSTSPEIAKPRSLAVLGEVRRLKGRVEGRQP